MAEPHDLSRPRPFEQERAIVAVVETRQARSQSYARCAGHLDPETGTIMEAGPDGR